MGIVVLGAVFVDIKGYSLSQSVTGGKNAGRVLQVHGGVSRNVVEDIANLELKPTFLSVVDNSGVSTDVIEKLKRHKVHTEYIVRKDGGLGTWLAIFGSDGDVAASISQRPDLSELNQVLIDHGDEIIKSCDSIALEIDMESDILRKVFNLAEKYGKRVYAVVSNMAIAMERRDLMRHAECVVCNLDEAGILFSDDFTGYSPEELAPVIDEKVRKAQYSSFVVTMGEKGAVYTEKGVGYGTVPAQKTVVVDTTGGGDAFFAGVTAGLTYGKNLKEACRIGTRLASAVIATSENVSPRFQPEEFGLNVRG